MNSKIRDIEVNAIYVTYQGEVNHRGIGAPVIFLRLQGCHLRCYKKTMGILCDTPEGLERDIAKRRPIDEVVKELVSIKEKTGIDYICLTGGDPLWRHKEQLHQLFTLLLGNGFYVSVETSGTISTEPFNFYDVTYKDGITWVLDYKLKSAGLSAPFHKDNYGAKNDTVVKFVIADKEDLYEATNIIRRKLFTNNVIYAFGLFWGTTNITYKEMMDYLMKWDILSSNTVINFQSHKMAEFYDANAVTASQTHVRTKI